jgi:hypothetical protein
MLTSESPLPGHVNATVTADVPGNLTRNTKGKNAKARSAVHKSGLREQAATSSRKRRKMPRAQSSDASEDCASDDDLVPRGERSLVPLLRLRAISSLRRIVYGLARPVRARAPPRANATWRVVEPPPPRSAVPSAKRPLAPLNLRPRVWAGVGQKPFCVDRLMLIFLSHFFFLREKTSFLRRSRPLRKIRVASFGKVPTSCLSSRRGRATRA